MATWILICKISAFDLLIIGTHKILSKTPKLVKATVGGTWVLRLILVSFCLPYIHVLHNILLV